MSIIIKGMKMPKTCDDCTISCDHDAHIDGYKMVKPSRFCPLVELPPHRRLIDADALTHLMGMDEYFTPLEAMYLMELIADAPTIVEAEETE